ncbi:hypothetical protein ACFQ0B_68995 [Nonomuraea thailandensis]
MHGPGDALAWDSGWIDGQDVSADYGGAPLVSFARYTWRVEVRGGGSARSWFDTGVLHADEWRAAWIEHDPETQPPFEPPTDDREPAPRAPPTCPRPATSGASSTCAPPPPCGSPSPPAACTSCTSTATAPATAS